MTPLRIIFMGTPDFAVPALAALHGAGHEIAAVYAQPPRRAGRGKQPRRSPVQAKAEALGLSVLTPVTLRDAAAQRTFAAHEADLAVVAAYGLILPPAILSAPRLGCFNIHASVLPRWRGAAPIHRAIMSGDAETGVTIMKMDQGLDTGAMALVETTPIGPLDTTATLHDRLAAMGAALMVEAASQLAAGELPLTLQPDTGVTYAAKIDKAEARIDWARPAVEIERTIRALTPFPGAWFEAGGERIKVHGALLVPGGTDGPGKVLDHDLAIQCGVGALRLTSLQRAGKRAMDAAEFQRGKPISAGEVIA